MRFCVSIIRWLAVAAAPAVIPGAGALYAHGEADGFLGFQLEWQEVMIFLGAVLIVLLGARILFGRKRRRLMRQHRGIYRALNIPLWVVDSDGRILLSQTETPEHALLADALPIPEADVLALVRGVLADGEARTREYAADGKTFRASFQCMDDGTFGRPTALVFSVEISELSQARAL